MTAHAHRYRMEEASGPVSRGVCACGAECAGYNAYVGDLDGEAPPIHLAGSKNRKRRRPSRGWRRMDDLIQAAVLERKR